MNKNEVIREVARKAGISQAEARRIVEITLGVISEHLKSGDDVKLKGFGHFSTKGTAQAGKAHRDTQAHAKGYSGARPTFKASEKLRVNVRRAGKDSSDPDKTNDPGEFIKGIRK
ncbi:TPA: HU family DNA-binding protein [Vibrio parahaemolyticus]|uniref:HU family DNA-binding protein n=1 Tax=Vibrio parahaemolyticus TaxID=670 RepID=UPI0015DF8F27|nr:HU family DNA-binding protein [Vibrio parahaemolyticus]HCM0873371.1 HU family DNA-binding protein [Vibrio parahaemolyticus]